MKNKKTAWILLPAVLLIWGLLGWKIYAAMKDDVPPTFTASTTPAPVTHEAVVPDTYQLQLNYPDPFLTTKKTPVRDVRTSPENPNSTPSPKVLTPVAPAAWPELRYAGLVQSKDGKTLGFLSVNGQSHFVKANDVIDEIVVQKIWKDSVRVVRGKEKRVVKK
jgi:hypothetical protein